MNATEIVNEIIAYAGSLNLIEFSGLVFGLLAVILLVKDNILTWPAGIIYTVLSLYVFWDARLYADLLLHVFYLGMNGYGWYFWTYGKQHKDVDHVPITTARPRLIISLLMMSGISIAVMGYVFASYSDAALPYWDSTTTILSFAGMWLTARKKIENWIFWFVVDIVATGVYYYKGLYFYSFLYLVYIGLAVVGYLEWKRIMEKQDFKAINS